MAGSKLIGVRMPDDLAQELEAKAAEQGLSTSEFLRKLVDDALYPSTGKQADVSETSDKRSELETRLEKLEDFVGVKEPTGLDRLLGTDKPIAEQLEQHKRQLTDLGKQVGELTNRLNSTNSNTELTRVAEQTTKLSREVTDIKNRMLNVQNNKESVNNGLGKLEREVGDLRSKLQPLTALPSKVETLKSDVARLSNGLTAAERRAKRQPTGNTVTLQLTDRRDHTFREYKSPDGLVNPYIATHDLITGKRYVDLSEALD